MNPKSINMKKILFFIALAAIFTSCASTQVVSEQRTATYTYKNKKGTFRVTNTYIRKVDTLSLK